MRIVKVLHTVVGRIELENYENYLAQCLVVEVHKCLPHDNDEDITHPQRVHSLFICAFVHFLTKTFQHLPLAKHCSPAQGSAGVVVPSEMPFKKSVLFNSQPRYPPVPRSLSRCMVSVFCFLTCIIPPGQLRKCLRPELYWQMINNQLCEEN